MLAQQHYSTFSERLQAFPVSVEVLSRFRTDAEQRGVVEGLAAGKVDICIGTHRLIQKDVSFKDLGLVIVDEEQRFGVAHKERLKEMRREVDVLTLTATPIPRTLHLSLAGVRDMSRIETPPEERLPIKTYVSEFSDELIREAIRREIDRQGQVFFVHNRVYNIDYMAGYIRMLVPEAEVAVGHGQMPEHELERAMLGFAEGSTDVLVCTTIIESGPGHPERQRAHNQSGGHIRPGPALSAPWDASAGGRGERTPTCWCRPTGASTRSRRRGSRRCWLPPSSGPDSRSP